MSFALTSKDYAAYLARVAGVIRANRDYISDLDAATGDGDHWANLNAGFEKLTASAGEIAALPIPDALRRIGMLMMSAVGGSSGVLYGGAYMAAGKVMAGKETLDAQDLCSVLSTMLEDLCRRGNSQPGFKTIIDALHPAVEAFQKGLSQSTEERQLLRAVKQAAEDGAQATRQMEAVRGRAYYQPGRGVGHLDPGAVTMAMQIGALMDYIIETKLS